MKEIQPQPLSPLEAKIATLPPMVKAYVRLGQHITSPFTTSDQVIRFKHAQETVLHYILMDEKDKNALVDFGKWQCEQRKIKERNVS